jgi:hypothetical protein
LLQEKKERKGIRKGAPSQGDQSHNRNNATTTNHNRFLRVKQTWVRPGRTPQHSVIEASFQKQAKATAQVQGKTNQRRKEERNRPNRDSMTRKGKAAKHCRSKCKAKEKPE